MASPLSRRLFLRRSFALGAAGVGLLAVKGAQEGLVLLDQHETWVEAARPNSEFFARHASDLDRLTLGASFAPEQFRRFNAGSPEALGALEFAVNELNMHQLRLGLRWNRTATPNGDIDLSFYRPYLEYCLSHDVDICLNAGPIRVFRWPEEHVPRFVFAGLPQVPPADATISADEPLAVAAFSHLERLLERLTRDYGQQLAQRVTIVQVENEPYYELGEHRWHFSPAYMERVTQILRAGFPDARVLVTSAGRLHLHIIRDLFLQLLAKDAGLAGKLISGFDFHYKTPLRDSYPIIRHFDQLSYARPFAPSTEGQIRDARDIGYRIEVTEGQAEPYSYLTSPGNSATDLRFLILRLMDKVLDPRAPALIRIWGLEELGKRFLRGEATEQHRQMLEIIQNVNADAPGAKSTRASDAR